MFVALMQVAVVYDDSEDRSVDCIRERAGRIALPRSVSGAFGDAMDCVPDKRMRASERSRNEACDVAVG
jgi:hypothetical protein